MSRLSMVCGLGILCLTFIVGAGASQDAKKDRKKETGKLKGMLPQGFKDLGLSPEQVQKIYAIQTEYKTKIDELNKQIKELSAKKSKEEFNVLTPDQREKYLKSKGIETKDKGSTTKDKATKDDDKKKVEDKK